MRRKLKSLVRYSGTLPKKFYLGSSSDEVTEWVDSHQTEIYEYTLSAAYDLIYSDYLDEIRFLELIDIYDKLVFSLSLDRDNIYKSVKNAELYFAENELYELAGKARDILKLL